MPQLISKNPSYRKHKPSGQAVVTIEGSDFYLGPYGSKSSKDEYDRIMAQWLANGRRLKTGPSTFRVAELIQKFCKHAKIYYRRPDGSKTSELSLYKLALRPLNRLYGTARVCEFGPLALDAVREHFIELGWHRRSVNGAIGRIKSMFKWGVSRELVEPLAHHALCSLAGLRAGRSSALESVPVKPVPESSVLQTLPFLSPTIAAMVQLQLLTGARPGEICILRTGDIDRSDPTWGYRPSSHKTSHRGLGRIIFIGPKAQKVLTPFLRMDPEAYCFSPELAEQERRRVLHSQRKTPLQYGNCPGTNKKGRPKWEPGPRYTAGSYCRAISRACELAFPPPPALARLQSESIRAWKRRLTSEERVQLQEWRREHSWHPHQLRHTAATEIRRRFGIEAAQTILGHASLDVTEIYAERNAGAARQIAAAIG